MTAGKSLLSIGYGYTAQALARRLSRDGWRVSGTTRAAEKAATMKAQGVTAQLWDDSEFNPEWLDGVQAVLISTPPGADGCPAFLAAGKALAERAQDIEWLGYLSTNGVYGDHRGAWVDETSDLRPTTERARQRILAETDWAALAENCGLKLMTFRLPGIYGPGRSALDTVRAGKARRIFKEDQVFSRMHVDDIAAALVTSMEKPRAHDLYNLADDEPAAAQDVVEYACTLLGVEPPPLVALEQAQLSEMARSFYADNKRVSNRRMKEALDVSLAYPTYREGLSAIFAAEKA